jgi:hypothetical protein
VGRFAARRGTFSKPVTHSRDWIAPLREEVNTMNTMRICDVETGRLHNPDRNTVEEDGSTTCRECGEVVDIDGTMP